MCPQLLTTAEEVRLQPDDILISCTTTKGLITYVNDDFIRISEYSREELLGQPHNLVRHPDMPKEAFRDLWATIKAGNPWEGLVKNQTKTGKFYWVKATVTPMTDGTGYTSLRTCPTDKEIQAASKLYIKKDLKLNCGVPQSTPLFNRASKIFFAFIGPLQILFLGISFFLLTLADHHTPLPDKWFYFILVFFTLMIIRNAIHYQKYVRSLEDFARNLNQLNFSSSLPPQPSKALKGLTFTLQSMRNRMGQSHFSLRDGLHYLDTATQQLNRSSNQIVHNVQFQTEQTTHIASAIEELSTSQHSISEVVLQLFQSSEKLGKDASQSAEEVEQNIAELQSSTQKLQEAGSELSRMMNVIQSVQEAINMIDDISRQIRFLSINASIQAAKTRGQGDSFHVIASEIRKLADRTTQASDSMKDSLGNVEEENQLTLKKVQSNIHILEQISQKSRHTITSFQSLTERTLISVGHLKSLQRTMQEQTLATDEIAKAIEALSLQSEETFQTSQWIQDSVLALETSTNALNSIR